MQQALTAIVPHLRYQLVRIGPAGQAGVAALVAAALIGAGTLLPARTAIQGLSEEILQAQHHSHNAVTADDTLTRVVTALPTRDQMPTVLGQVFAQAQKAGVQLESGRYVFTAGKPGGLARYDLQFPLKAAYPELRDFIDRTLTAVPAAGLEKLRIERKAVGDTVVNADVHFVVFVRTE